MFSDVSLMLKVKRRRGDVPSPKLMTFTPFLDGMSPWPPLNLTHPPFHFDASRDVMQKIDV